MARTREALRTDRRTYTEPRPIYVSRRGRHITRDRAIEEAHARFHILLILKANVSLFFVNLADILGLDYHEIICLRQSVDVKADRLHTTSKIKDLR